MGDNQPTPPPDGFVFITNWYATRRHYAKDAALANELGSYRALCGTTHGKSLEKDEAYRRKHGYRQANYSEVPICQLCTAKLAKLVNA